MRRWCRPLHCWLACSLTVAVACAPDAAIARRTEYLAEIRSAELSFAATAQRINTRDAFLEFLAPGSVLFRPGPVDGREVTAAGPPSAGSLQWTPADVDISAAGDLGFTFGPFTARNAEGVVAGWGEYVSMWQRQPDGALDVGTGFPEPAPDGGEAATIAPARPVSRSGHDAGAEISVLMELDRGGLQGLSETARATGETRVFRNGAPSWTRANPPLSAPARPVSWQPMGGTVAESGDLATPTAQFVLARIAWSTPTFTSGAGTAQVGPC